MASAQFSKGKASRIYDRVRDERLSEMEENYHLLLEVTERLKRAEGKPSISMAESMAEFGITQEDLDAMEDPLIK